MALDRFELPRTDWYDSSGRIYKDALIENFNALEEIMLRIQSLDTIEVETVDYDTISLNDVTLDDGDNKIINLRSLINILGLTYYPIECITSGKKVVKYSYYNDNFELVTISDVSLDTLSDSVPYVVLNKSTGTIQATSSFNNSAHILIGTFRGGAIDHVLSPGMCDINILEALSKMPVRSRVCYTSRKKDRIFWLTDPARYICYGIHAKYGRKSGGQYCVCCDQGEPNFRDGYFAKEIISQTNGSTNCKGF